MDHRGAEHFPAPSPRSYRDIQRLVKYFSHRYMTVYLVPGGEGHRAGREASAAAAPGEDRLKSHVGAAGQRFC